MANPTPDQRTTKAERKEQARREREQLQRRQAASRRNRRIVVAIGAVAVVAATVFFLTRPEAVRADPEALLETAAAASQEAGCSSPEDVGPYQPEDRDQEHGPLAPLSSYASTPPASGPHSEGTLPGGVYQTPPPLDRLIHSLEHGAAVVWYSPAVTGPALQELKAFYESDDVGSRVIVAPYDYPAEGEAGALPQGVQMSLVAWHTVEHCARVDVGAAFDFTSGYAGPPFGDVPYEGTAPEAGAVL
ncbi:MAG TPA: DUF3105 domain-containing protein [Actinomycetota bacterium]|nr:DUF3105 domain-containing protein [Actinomycetota bacterium]